MDREQLGAVPHEAFAERRSRVFEEVGTGVMVLSSAPIQHASRDTERTYAPDRDLYYLTGWTEPDSVAVLVGGDDPRFVLFVRDRDPSAELWSGPRLGVEGALDRVAPEACHPITELEDRLPELLAEGDRIHYRFGRRGLVERLVLGALQEARARGPRTGSGPRAVVDPGEIIDEMRLRKGPHEIEAIRRACAITVGGHAAGAAAIAPGVGEWMIEAAVDGAFRSAGAAGAGFETIVGGGANACVLHYVANADTLREGTLVLLDAGAEWGLYHGDVTRTYPVSGRFDDAQRAVYDAVEQARVAALAAVRPGATIGSVHEAAVEVLVDGLLELGALEGSRDDLVESGAFKPYFPHQTSHWLGLDVHDPGDYARNGSSRSLEPGMVFTVEPGLYFGESAAESLSTLRGIGVRIEDDVLVTEAGHEVLSAGLPTAADEIEALLDR